MLSLFLFKFSISKNLRNDCIEIVSGLSEYLLNRFASLLDFLNINSWLSWIKIELPD